MLSQNWLLENIKFETPQVNVIEIEKIFIPLLPFLYLHAFSLFAHNVIISSNSVYASLIHAKVCEYKNYKENENKHFLLHLPLGNTTVCLPLEIPQKQWSDVSVR